MELVACRACGSKELSRQDGVATCLYCQSQYVIDIDPQSRPGDPVGDPDTFDVILTWGGQNSIAVVREVRALTGLSQREALALVTSTPSTVLTGVNNATAAGAKARIEAAGGALLIETAAESVAPLEAPTMGVTARSRRRRSTALWLAVLLGFYGVDRFYLGYTSMGFIKLFTAGGFGVLWVLDAYRILRGTLTDVDGLTLA